MERDSLRLSALEDIGLPHPREEALSSVREAREFVYENDGATKAALVDALEPETNHRIGLHATQAVGKIGDVDGYRDWWWQEVVEPGLRALPDVESHGTRGEPWRPVTSDEGTFAEGTDAERDEESQPGPESADDFRDMVEDGALFELTYREDGTETCRLVSFDRKVRPSALPVGSPPTFRFESIPGGESVTVSLPDTVDLRRVRLDQIPEQLANRAVPVLVVALRDEPDRVSLAECRTAVELRGDATPAEIRLRLLLSGLDEGGENLEDVADRLFDLLKHVEGVIGERALRTLANRAAMEPSAVDPYVTDIASLANESAYPAQAMRCIATIAEEDPASVIDVVPSLAATAESASQPTRRWVYYTFTSIAEDYPEELLPALDVLISGIADEDQTVRTNTLSAVGRIASAYPDAAAAIVDDVAELLDSEGPMVRANATGLLGDIAQEHPAAVMEHAPKIAARLADDDADARYNASNALLEAGEANPAAIRNEADRLTTALSDDDPEVRANACLLVGNAGADVPLDHLAHLSEEDPDKTVRERASWALGRLK